MDLIKISPSIINNRLVGYYFLYKISVLRGIKRKEKSKEDELLIIGVPLKNLKKYSLDHKDEIYKYLKEVENEKKNN